VKNVGLKKGSELAFQVQEDSSIILVPRKIMEKRREAEKPKPKEYWILIRTREDPQSVRRKITSLYVVGAGIIHVSFEEGDDLSKYKMVVSNLVRNALLGSEIIDETRNEVTIQILINHAEFPIEKAIRRMAVLALSANREVVSSLKDGDKNLIQSITDMRNDLNRLNLYVIRQLKFGLERNLFKELGFRTPKEFLGYRIVVNEIKNIVDDAVNIANNIAALRKLINEQMLFLREAIDEEVYSQILDFNSSVYQLFEEALKAMFKRNYERADSIISKVESLAELESELVTLMSSKKMDPNVSSIFRLILNSSRRVMICAQNIAEVTLNRTIEETTFIRTFE
jgi:phosphate uptake regulator